MRLTNYIREAFVASAMNDVPRINYEEEAQKLATEMAVALLPSKIATIYKDKALRDYVGLVQVKMINCGFAYGYFMVPGLRGCSFSPEFYEKLKEFGTKNDEQITLRKALKDKLTGAAQACNTRQQLAEMLPEFEKYLPALADNAGRSLPVVANIVTDFMKAGWPKNKPVLAVAKKAA